MISKKNFHYINELQELQRAAVECPVDVFLLSDDGTMKIDAKSYIGMYALDFAKPISVQCEDASFHKRIHNIGENVE